MNPLVRIVLMVVSWFVWILPVLPAYRQRQKAVQVDNRARTGMALQTIGYFLVFAHGPQVWSSPLQIWRAIAGGVFALIAIALFRSGTANLGRQWRLDAGLNEDHALVQTGAYSIVRHPIYASMLGIMMAGIFWVGTLPAWPVGLVLFLAGTEVRVRVEDALLRGRFGERFTEWQSATPAYLPFVR